MRADRIAQSELRALAGHPETVRARLFVQVAAVAED
jgi:hypothetical protein